MASALSMSTKLVATAATNIPHIKKVVSFEKFRYGHDPSHYPIKALKFVFSHKSLWKRIFWVAFAGVCLAFLCLLLLLIFALHPQAMAFGGGQWWSWLLAVLAVLLEAALMAALLMSVAQSKAQTEVFTETMKLEGCWEDGRMKKQSVIKDFQFLKKNFFVRVITYPLNLIPVAGAALYSAINATFIGWDYMDRYFDAIKLDGKLQRIEVLGEDRSDISALFHRSTYDNDNEYARFGFIVANLETIPIVGPVFFPLINACAAGLFACDIEKAGGPSVLRGIQEGTDDSATTNTRSKELITATTGTEESSSLPYATDRE